MPMTDNLTVDDLAELVGGPRSPLYLVLETGGIDGSVRVQEATARGLPHRGKRSRWVHPNDLRRAGTKGRPDAVVRRLKLEAVLACEGMMRGFAGRVYGDPHCSCRACKARRILNRMGER